MSTQTFAVENAANPDPLATELRVYERHSCEIPTKCHPVSLLDMKEAGWSAAISDLSQGGVRLRLQRRFERGTGLAIDLPGDGQREASVVFVKVANITPHEEGGWILGCRFVSELSEDETQRLLASTQDAPRPEEEVRQAPPCPDENAPQTKHLTDVRIEIELDDATPFFFTIRRLDVSKSWPVSQGKVLRINGISKNQAKWTFEIEVVQLQPRGNGWHLRSRLVKPGDADTLREAFRRAR